MKNLKNISRYLTTLLALTVFGAAALGSGSSDSDTASKVGEVTKETSSVADESKNETKDEAKGEKADDEKEEPKDEIEQEAEVKSEYVVGDTINTKNLKLVFMESGEYISDNQFITPKDGYKFVYIKLYAENISNSDQSVSAFSFKGFADGYSVDQHYSSDENLSAQLSSGRTTTGIVCFEIPVDTSEFEIEYEYDAWNDKKLKLIYEGDKKSDFTPEANTEKSADAFDVGSIVETKKLRLSYLSCEDYTSDNPFITPKDDYKFISLMFEVENISDSDQHISYFDFKCFADGVACDASYSRDDALSADLSAGRKGKGSITFEVPVDATTVEVECETNLWTQDKIVFSCN